MLMAFLVIGAFYDLKARGPKFVELWWVLLLIAVQSAIWLSKARAPVMPLALFAITGGALYTSFLRLREIAMRLRTIKAARA